MKTVLVIDDEPEFLALIRQRLGAFFSVLTAADGEEGLAAAFEKKPDLILLDILMPKLDGYGVVRRLRKNADFKNTPIVLVSAVAETHSLLEADELGAADYLIKPIELDGLPKLVEHYIRTGPMPI